jgi:hypothetical protein
VRTDRGSPAAGFANGACVNVKYAAKDFIVFFENNASNEGLFGPKEEKPPMQT